MHLYQDKPEAWARHRDQACADARRAWAALQHHATACRTCHYVLNGQAYDRCDVGDAIHSVQMAHARRVTLFNANPPHRTTNA